MMARSGAGAPSGGAGNKPQQIRENAAEFGHDATRAGSQVVQQAAGQGKQVAAETGRQARDLVGQASEQVRQQAGAQQKRAADGLRALGTQLQSMASKSEQDGGAKEIVVRASDAAQHAAGWLEGREPGELVNEVRDYARHHPGTFLAGAAVAGLLVGRLTRGMAGSDGGRGEQRSGQGTPPAGMPAGPSAETPQTQAAPGGATANARVPDRGVNR
jgi:hypothetical protein